jgi:glycosyltransferase involved in cell wall biosynthesis
MRIGLNLLHAHPSIGGGWNYIKSLVQSLQSYDKENTYIAYCTPFSKRLITEQENTKIISIGIDGTNRMTRILYENLFLQLRTRNDNVDVLHWFANTRSIYCSVPSIITVYDLLAFHSSMSHSLFNRIYKYVMVPYSLRMSNVIAPMSETTKSDIHNRFEIDSGKMIVIPPIIDDMFKPVESMTVKNFRDKYRLPDHYWLYVAHYYPHKNHERLFQAYAILRTRQKTTWPLVLCGMKNGADKVIAEKLHAAGIENNVMWLPKLDDSEMPTLYSAASALVFPSLYEGGGIPIMEALACGCPVVASDIPTTKEFAGNSTVLCFDGENIEDMVKAMLQFANNDVLRDYKLRGLEKAKTYRKDSIIPRLLNAYKIACQGDVMNNSMG